MVRPGLLAALVLAGGACRTPPPPLPSPPPQPPPVVAPPPRPPASTPPPPPGPPTTWDVTPRADSMTKLEQRLIADAGVPEGDRQVFPEGYAVAEGVFTFRGGPARTGGAWGTVPVNPSKLEVAWKVDTGRSREPWFGGAGWTGQPVIVRWPAVIRHSMPKLKKLRQKDALVEVIQGSLDGSVYFIDLHTGKKTRAPLKTGNPIKGSVSLDPRGYPLLFVGQGIPWRKPVGLRVFELIGHREVFFLAGNDKDAPRKEWRAFDSSGLLNRKTDTFVVGGENGLVYLLHLNTAFDPLKLTLKVAPQVVRYRYRENGSKHYGVENSLSVDRNLAFFADNAGAIQAVDLRTFAPVWAFDAGDDTDATLTLELEEDRPVLYTGCEVDKTGPRGRSHVRKLDGLSGTQRWERSWACQGALTPKKIDAGVFATPAVGTGDVADLVYFSLARCPGPENGFLVALDKRTGEDRWRLELPKYSWSTPTLVKDKDGKSYLLHADQGGLVRLLDARTGRVVTTLQLEGEIEASPAVFEDMAVLGTRADRIYGLRIRGSDAE